MEKIDNFEAAKIKETANAFLEKRRDELSGIYKSLSSDQLDFLQLRRYMTEKATGKLRRQLKEGLDNGTYKTPSVFFEKECVWLFGTLIFDSLKDSFLYAVDNCIRYPYTVGIVRRPIRSEMYSDYISKMVSIIHKYLAIYLNKTVKELIYGDLTDEERAFARTYHSYNQYEVAYYIDKGDKTVINWISDALDSDSPANIAHDKLRGIFCSSNEELCHKAGKLLLAAGLQEGLRQAICETCDEGTYASFRIMLGYINDAGLIRFSSVKRAVGTWTGVVAADSNDLERIGKKELKLVIQCLDDEEYCRKCTVSSDAMECYTGIWATACRSVHKAMDMIDRMIEDGEHRRVLIAALSAVELSRSSYTKSKAYEILTKYPEKHDAAALMLPYVIDIMDYQYHESCGKTAFDALAGAYYNKREELEETYGILYRLFTSMTSKEEVYSNVVFPWITVKLERSRILRMLMLMCGVLKDDDKTDEMCGHLDELENKYGSRSVMLEVLLSHPNTDIQKDALVSYCASKEKYTRLMAFELIKKMELSPKHYLQLEEMLKYKNDETRSGVLAVLMEMNDDSLFAVAERLISDKKEEKRTAGLDIVKQLSADENRSELFSKAYLLIEKIKNPTSKEKMLIESINPADGKENKDTDLSVFYEESDGYTPIFEEEYIREARKVFMEYYPNSEICGEINVYALPDFIPILKKLDRLIDEHKNDEVYCGRGEAELLGSCRNLYYRNDNGERCIPLSELWDSFYENEIGSERLLLRAASYLILMNRKLFRDMAAKIYGEEFNVTETFVYPYYLNSIITYLKDKHCSNEKYYEIGKKFLAAEYDYLCKYPDTAALFDFEKVNYPTEEYYVVDGEIKKAKGYVRLIVPTYLSSAARWIDFVTDDKLSFPLIYSLAVKTGTLELIKRRIIFKKDQWGNNIHSVAYLSLPDNNEYIRAAYYGIISDRFMYKHFFTEQESLKETMNLLSSIEAAYKDRSRNLINRRFLCGNYVYSAIGTLIGSYQRVRDNAFTEDDIKLIEYAVGINRRLSELVLDSEIRRGDSAGEYSLAAFGINRVYGIERFVQILTSLGKEKLDRKSYYFGNGAPSRKQSLSHLLGVCVPKEDDDAVKLKTLLKGTDITEKRLVEVALFAPQWMDIIQEYLGWKGFTSACYYFIAHTDKYIDNVKSAYIAKYTPISIASLMHGVFDINWFREAYAEVGEKRFNMIYDAAKYISDGAKHTRARKYADAVLGKLPKEETEKNISEKRNKDTLMAYALIPLKDEEDMVERYVFIQRFLKESKKFGTQRRESEAKAVETALQNLAVNAGFDDDMRLTLRMEAKLFDTIRTLTEFTTVGDIEVRLVTDEIGKTAIECIRDGKSLKSVPAKYKKDAVIVRMNEVKKMLNEQYSRTKKMFEQSMEDRTVFTTKEIDLLMMNPVSAAILRSLVWTNGKDMGFFSNMTLTSPDGKKKKLKLDSKLIVAHSFDLYKSGKWYEYQKYLFENKIIQPFKQVFRELYVKTEDEMEMTASRRYSGNQIRPRQTLGCLGSRRWKADFYDGLQKVYFKENIIARIYARTDWFSPSEVEAPTLELVEFFDRMTGYPIKIKDIPDVLFSEVMRDVDLAVSIAHTGGTDPETSLSTIEMRRALCEFTIPLFKLKNVTFEKNHALINGSRGDYSVHLGSGIIHLQGGPMVNVSPVHSQHRGRIFLPFADEDPKTSEILTKVLLFAEDKKIKDPYILEQITR